ncbi:MAG: hypothetical protein CMN91_12030 [Synechococcus sp. ARS1019]|nr:hypothetical protein [Synechococcus sp. ARS1019]|tara:strand:+ start:1167 stop:1349 length:183 start_codon:yes stop_codon:yes gene_type:complete
MFNIGIMLGELEISNATALFLAIMALIFVSSFAVVSLQTGDLIKPQKTSDGNSSGDSLNK